MQDINAVMSILESGQWLNFKDVMSFCSLLEGKVKLILNFLTEFDLIQVKKGTELFRLHPSMIGLINRLRDDSSEEVQKHD